ncbi:precorrin 3B synthase CobZ [Ophiocordyceps camponoti-floridani]|uniref:Precorrin 3B synthase CobZ n=1 Tax=Ophiocordyceps camponoti-floridani TaxID=2030778 RepID=A0A8H4VC89_9HYPO|nr:precorrin 3B synthase CobZ [Ophiocordyceps camponoti-floridani]
MSRCSCLYSVVVNLQGRCFMDEGENRPSRICGKTGAAIVGQPGGTTFQVFDQKTLHLFESGHRAASPVEAETLQGLAKKLGLPVKSFCDTTREFNAATPASSRDNFNPFDVDGVSTGDKLSIPKSNWALPIDERPFVAYGVTCGITSTYGGLKTDSAGRVLNQERLHMPGLWAIGEISRGFFAFDYPEGTGLLRGAVFGKIV